MSVTAIVLAGGRSRRFGGDKLAAEIDGETVLSAAIRAVAPLADLVIVAGPALPEDLLVEGLGADDLRPDAATDTPVMLVPDVEPFAGPLASLAKVLQDSVPIALEPSRTGLGQVAIVVGGDMPRLVASVLARMLDVLDVDPTVDAVILGRPDVAIATNPPGPERRQVLPLAVRVQPAARASREAVETGRQSLQALVDALAAVELPPSAWLAHDPGAATLLDVDTPADLIACADRRHRRSRP